MKTTPIWLLDVDGVLNALPWASARWEKGVGATVESAWADLTETRSTPDLHLDPADGYHITYSPALMREIRKLHESGAVEVRWLTTWGSGANVHLNKQLGLPAFDVAGEPPETIGYTGQYSSRTWWKLGHVERIHAEEPHRPIIWTDDDLEHVDYAREWAHSLGFLPLAPDETVGITPGDLQRIKEFIQSANARAVA